MLKLLNKLAILLLLFVPLWAGAAPEATFWIAGTAAGAGDGSSYANRKASITWGTTAGTVGRGSKLYVCGTPSNPVTFALNPSGVGAFDGTVNADTDVLEISGEAAQCGGTQGVIANSAANGILASGILAVKIHDLTIRSPTSNGVSQLLGTATCAVSGSYYCSHIYNITCTDAGVSCVNVSASGNTTFPATDIPAVLIDGVTSYHAGGSACRKRLNTTNAVIRNCKSYNGEGYGSNTWPVYAAGIVLNCGAANSGAGVTWTNVSGTVYKVSQVSCGATTGATIIQVAAGNPAAGVAQILAVDGTCTGDGDCAGSSGTWGQVGDVVYVNKGDMVQSTAAIDLDYNDATGTVITQAWVEDASNAYDGNSIGLDFGENSGVIERSFAKNSPTFGFVSGRGTVGNTIRSSINVSAGDAAIRVNGTANVYNFSSSGNADIVDALVHTGETLTIRNVGGSGVTNVYTDALAEGTITQSNNSSANPLYVGGTSPTTPEGFRLKSTSPLLCAGTFLGRYPDYGSGFLFKQGCVDIGAWAESQRTDSSVETRTDTTSVRNQ